MFEHIFYQSCEKTLILTVNQRLSLSLQREHNRWQQSKGQVTWPSLAILPLNSWVKQQWLQHTRSQSILLSSWQEQQLWHQCVEQDERFALIQTQATALQAQQAWQTMISWQLSTRDIAPHANHEVATFIQWSEQCEQVCQQQGWIRTPEIILELIALIENRCLQLPQRILMIGFDDLSPAINTLITAIGEQTFIEQISTQQRCHSLSRLQLPDRRCEITTMARWAKHLWQQDSTQRIACVVPNLTELRDHIEQIFIDTFNPNGLIDETCNLPFNCSAGQPLARFTLINTALQGLKLCSSQHAPLTRWLDWLQSPYNHHHAEDDACALALAALLQQRGTDTVSKATVAHLLTQLHPVFPQSTWLQRWHALSPAIPHAQIPSQWAQFIIDTCHHWGWPGGRNINSLEHQLLQSWQGVIKELASLDTLQIDMTLQLALDTVQKLLHQTLFQTEGSDAPIQILGVLEASGYEFDHLWFMNINDETWPAAAQANPFLPTSIQKQYRMPHADGERERAFAQQVQQRLCDSSSHVIISHHQTQGERQFQASPLVRHYPEISLKNIKLADAALSQYNQPIPLSTQPNPQAPALQPQEQPRGGTWILKQQAQCPFKAFAKTRLNAHTAAQPHVGLSPSQAGTLVHATLEAVWQQLKNHANLVQYNDTALHQCVAESFDRAIRNTAITDRVAPYFIALEKHRLCRLLVAWLNLEKQREPFKVLAHEQVYRVQSGQLEFSISIDRIDQLDNGEHVIIDYKTHPTQLSPWFQPRLDDPQIPLYYLTVEPSLAIAGVGYAQVKASQLQFKGLLNDHYENQSSEHIPGFTAITQVRQHAMSWSNWHSHCQQGIDQLVAEFCRGEARVDPIHPSACLTCDLQPLCRVFES